MTDDIMQDNQSLSSLVSSKITRFLNDNEEQDAGHLYQLVLEQIEEPLLQVVMENAQYNQSRAAQLLGLSRGTLRTKLKKYFDNKYMGKRRV